MRQVSENAKLTSPHYPVLTKVNGSPFQPVTGLQSARDDSAKEQAHTAPMQEQMQEQIETLKEAQIASMEAQIAPMQSQISSMQELVETLNTEIARLKGG